VGSKSRPFQESGIAGGRTTDSPYQGTLLTREWNGKTVLVEALAIRASGIENQSDPSLSAIAVAVTGTRWNGLAFFGLTRPAGDTVKATIPACPVRPG